jgi:ADP-ribose pyrophosphatase
VLEECRGKRFRLARVEAVAGGRRVVRDVLLHPGAVAVLAVENGRVLLERQYRVPVGGWIYEIPAGTIEPGEEPAETARRELREETGYEAEKLTHLMTIYPSPGVSTERIHIYLAEGLRMVGASPEPDEVIETLWVPLEEAVEMVRRGEIADAKTVAALLYYTLIHRGA